MTRSPAPRRLAAAVLATLALGVLGACGSSDNSSSDSASSKKDATATSAAPAADKKAPAGDTAATEGDTVDIKDFAFNPPNLKVKVGTEVTFTNKDDAPHTATAEDKSFDSKSLSKDATFKQTFDKAGTYKYFCAIHNYMTGQITVA